MQQERDNNISFSHLQRTQPSICSVAFWSQWPMAYSNFWYCCMYLVVTFGLITLEVFSTRFQLGGFCHRPHRSLGFSSSGRQPKTQKSFFNSFCFPDLHDGIWLEVDVSIEGKQESVVCPMSLLLLSLQAVVAFQLVAKEVVHVHDLGPPAHGFKHNDHWSLVTVSCVGSSSCPLDGKSYLSPLASSKQVALQTSQV